MKLPTTVSEQINLLKIRGLVFKDEAEAINILSQNNYYRLTGYWRKYQINPDAKDDRFVSGATFERIIEIYELDTELRNLLLKGSGIFEICFRSKFAYHAAHSVPNGSILYLEQSSYNNNISKNEEPESLLKKINEELQRSNEKYVAHFRKRGEQLPIWVAVETLTFSTVSKMFSRWTDKAVIKKVSQHFKLFKNYAEAIFTIRALVYLRNLCAHQARIWNRELIVKVADKRYLQNFGDSKERAPWRIISVLMSLVDEINQNDTYSKNVLNLCKQNEEFYKGLIEPTL
jgi:abortive infection bacteriophage resistance protein